MPSHNRTDQLELLIAGSLPFEGQRWYHHVLLVVGGFAVWTGAYAAAMYLTGSIELATVDSAEALAARQQGARVAHAITMTYFMLLWLRGYGGFIISWMWYPILIFALRPEWAYALGGSLSGRAATTTSLSSNMFVFTHEVVRMTLPSIVIAMAFLYLVLGHWVSEDEERDQKAATFFRKHPDRQIRVFADPEKYKNLGPKTREVFREAGAAPEEVLEEMGTDPRNKPSSDDATLRELVPALLIFPGLLVLEDPWMLVLILVLAVPAGGFYLFLWLLPGTKIGRREDREQ